MPEPKKNAPRETTPIVLDEKDRLAALKVIQETRNQLGFLYTLVSRDECTPQSANTHLSLLRNQFNDLSRLLDGGETISRALEQARADNRAANARIRDLESQLGAGVTAAAAMSRIRHLTSAFYTWMELHGFHYATVTHTDFGILTELSGEIETIQLPPDERVENITFGDRGLAMELAPVVPYLFGASSEWDVFSDRSTRWYLENTDANRARMNDLFREFPKVVKPQLVPDPDGVCPAIHDFTSRRQENHFDLGTKIFLSYEEIERWLQEASEKAKALKEGRKDAKRN